MSAPEKAKAGAALSLAEYAEMLGVSKRTVQRMVARREVKPINRNGHPRFIWRPL